MIKTIKNAFLDLKTSTRIVLFLIIISRFFFFSYNASALTADQNCSRCKSFLSESYCAGICCAACNSSLDGAVSDSQACERVCSISPRLTTSDQSKIDDCQSSSYALPGCEGLRSFLTTSNAEDYQRDVLRRVNSCNEAAKLTEKYCSLTSIQAAFPSDLYSQSQSISNSSCEALDLNQAQSYSGGISDEAKVKISSCGKSFERCKSFCMDANTVSGTVNGSSNQYTYEEGQKFFESICQPKYSRFLEQFNSKQRILRTITAKIEQCQGVVADSDFSSVDVTDLSATPDPTTSDPSTETPAGSKPGIFSNPEVALGNANQILSAVSPFMNQNTNNYNPGLYSSGQNPINLPVNNGNSNLSYEQKYGPTYEGYNTETADDMEYADPADFDAPQSLKTNPQQNRQGGGAGGFAGGGGMPLGGGGGLQNSSKPNAKGKRPTGSSDKAIFGKSISSGGGSLGGASEGQVNTKSSKFNFGSNSSLGLTTKKFDPGKYHASILASYRKGLNSRAQVLALRRAAGFKTESFSEKRFGGYQSWHFKNKIHPEDISIFMQIRICYAAKYRGQNPVDCQPRR